METHFLAVFGNSIEFSIHGGSCTEQDGGIAYLCFGDRCGSKRSTWTCHKFVILEYPFNMYPPFIIFGFKNCIKKPECENTSLYSHNTSPVTMLHRHYYTCHIIYMHGSKNANKPCPSILLESTQILHKEHISVYIFL